MPYGGGLFVNAQRFNIRRRLSLLLLSLPMWSRLQVARATAVNPSPARFGWEEVGQVDRVRILRAADAALGMAPVTIVKTASPLSLSLIHISEPTRPY